MCMFGGGGMPAPPPMPEPEDPNKVDGAGVPDDHGKDLTEKQRRFRAGQVGDDTDSLLK